VIAELAQGDDLQHLFEVPNPPGSAMNASLRSPSSACGRAWFRFRAVPQGPGTRYRLVQKPGYHARHTAAAGYGAARRGAHEPLAAAAEYQARAYLRDLFA
jgi:hypothetical protein